MLDPNKLTGLLDFLWQNVGIATAVFRQVLVNGCTGLSSSHPDSRADLQRAPPFCRQFIQEKHILIDTMATFQVGGLSHSFTASRSSLRFPHLHGPIESIETQGLCLWSSLAGHDELAAAEPCQQIPLQNHHGDDRHKGMRSCQESRHLVGPGTPRHKQAFPQDVAGDSCPEVTTHWRCRRQVLSREETEYSEHQL